MAGPSGVDQPAPDTPHMVSDPFRAFAAATQQDYDRAWGLLLTMTAEEFARLHEACAALGGLFPHAIRERRKRAEHA